MSVISFEGVCVALKFEVSILGVNDLSLHSRLLIFTHAFLLGVHNLGTFYARKLKLLLTQT